MNVFIAVRICLYSDSMVAGLHIARHFESKSGGLFIITSIHASNIKLFFIAVIKFQVSYFINTRVVKQANLNNYVVNVIVFTSVNFNFNFNLDAIQKLPLLVIPGTFIINADALYLQQPASLSGITESFFDIKRRSCYRCTTA